MATSPAAVPGRFRRACLGRPGVARVRAPPQRRREGCGEPRHRHRGTGEIGHARSDMQRDLRHADGAASRTPQGGRRGCRLTRRRASMVYATSRGQNSWMGNIIDLRRPSPLLHVNGRQRLGRIEDGSCRRGESTRPEILPPELIVRRRIRRRAEAVRRARRHPDHVVRVLHDDPDFVAGNQDRAAARGEERSAFETSSTSRGATPAKGSSMSRQRGSRISTAAIDAGAPRPRQLVGPRIEHVSRLMLSATSSSEREPRKRHASPLSCPRSSRPRMSAPPRART